MDDYIKRADALRWINNRESLNKYAETGDEQYLKFDAWDARQILDSIPAADVRENVRAKWLPMPEMLFSRRKQCYEPVITHYMCSRCGREEKERWEFCHCGAEMRGADFTPCPMFRADGTCEFTDSGFLGTLTCSACGEAVGTAAETKRVRFCPYCGRPRKKKRR